MSFSPLCRRLCKHLATQGYRVSKTASLASRKRASQRHTPLTAQRPRVVGMAQRTLMRAKVTCANTTHELDTIDCFTDDWDTGPDSTFKDPALDICLACQHAAAECKANVEILDGFLNNPSSGSQAGVFVEMDVRRENALGEIVAVSSIIEELAKTKGDPELSLQEIGKRAQRLVKKMEGLGQQIQELEKLAQVQIKEEIGGDGHVAMQ